MLTLDKLQKALCVTTESFKLSNSLNESLNFQQFMLCFNFAYLFIGFSREGFSAVPGCP